MTTLPTGIPRLDALVRAEAEQRAHDLYVAALRLPEVGGRVESSAYAAYTDGFETLLRNLSRRESRDWAAYALAELVGVEAGETAPRWTYSPAARDSVASWTLTGAGRSRWVLCDYPADIEVVLGPPEPERDGGSISVRNLPTGWAESMVVALAAVCRDG